MQAFHIIITIVAPVTYFALTFFAVSAWLTMRLWEKRLRAIEMCVAHTAKMTSAEHLRSTFNELNDMRRTLHQLIDEDRFEDAERMKQLLSSVEKSAMNAVKMFKERYGSDSVQFERFSDTEEGGCA